MGVSLDVMDLEAARPVREALVVSHRFERSPGIQTLIEGHVHLVGDDRDSLGGICLDPAGVIEVVVGVDEIPQRLSGAS
jgi:hypothetical protein